jgi:hypothetical protein
VQEVFRIDAKVIEEPLDMLLTAASNKLEREWPASVPCHPSSPVYLRAFVLVSHNIFRAMRYFCADKPPDPSRKPEYANAARPLARVILEIVFNVIFLLEDLTSRTERFEKAGWRSMAEDLERFTKSYGEDPDWSPYLKVFGDHVERGREFFRLTEAEFENPRSIPKWPLPRGMREQASTEVAAHLQYLADWFYKNLSEDAHVNWLGLVRLGAGLMGDYGGVIDVDWNLAKQKSDTLATTVILLLVLLSELEISLKLGLGPKLPYLWRIMNEGFLASKEVYVRRFDGRLD